MTENLNAKATRKKTPTDATPFEREQLRFFLSGGDLAATLAEFMSSPTSSSSGQKRRISSNFA
jgi:hypothetical protein